MIRLEIGLEIGLEIRHGGVMRVCAIQDKTAVIVVASYRSVSRNLVRFKALYEINYIDYQFYYYKHKLTLKI